MDRKGPGLLARDIAKGGDPQVEAVIRVLDHLQADVLLLTGFDYDYDLIAARLLSERLARPYPEIFAFAPNSGMTSPEDLDGDGILGDVQGWGLFAGQGAMLLMSRHPIKRSEAEDFSTFLWRDLPNNLGDGGAQRLSSVGHWRVPIDLGEEVHFLAYHATPPVFDGPEDRNGRRNHDEAAFWLAYLAGDLPMKPPKGIIVLLGTSNLDPEDGEGRPEAIRALLAHPLLQDLEPKSENPVVDPFHRGDPALDTARFGGIGGLRVEVLLADRTLTVTKAGILWPQEGHPLWPDLRAASRHGPVFIDIIPPEGKVAQQRVNKFPIFAHKLR